MMAFFAALLLIRCHLFVLCRWLHWLSGSISTSISFSMSVRPMLCIRMQVESSLQMSTGLHSYKHLWCPSGQILWASHDIWHRYVLHQISNNGLATTRLMDAFAWIYVIRFHGQKNSCQKCPVCSIKIQQKVGVRSLSLCRDLNKWEWHGYVSGNSCVSTTRFTCHFNSYNMSSWWQFDNRKQSFKMRVAVMWQVGREWKRCATEKSQWKACC